MVCLRGAVRRAEQAEGVGRGGHGTPIERAPAGRKQRSTFTALQKSDWTGISNVDARTALEGAKYRCQRSQRPSPVALRFAHLGLHAGADLPLRAQHSQPRSRWSLDDQRRSEGDELVIAPFSRGESIELYALWFRS